MVPLRWAFLFWPTNAIIKFDARFGVMKTKLWASVGGLAWCLLVLHAAAGQLEDGIAAHERRDDVTAIKLLRPLAEQGDAAAQEELGLLFYGKSRPAEALKWHLLAAEQGNVDAQYEVAEQYY